MAGLEKAFHNAMLEIFHRCKVECRYNPTRFLKMIHEHGGLEAARRILHSVDIQEGLIRLWELGRLDLSVEALVLKAPWNQLFTEQERATAKRRLKDFGYDTDP